jgi:alkylhydroperoxidase/carboxymuconolactone decarboxylase family protein YurZ
LDQRKIDLVTAAVLASRPQFREELIAELREIKSRDAVTRGELYEVFLQLYLFAGFPAALESVKALDRAWPLAEAKKQSETLSYPTYLDRGQQLYQEVYAKNAGVVRDEMLRLSPELAAWAVIEGYGKTLSRPGLDMLSRELTIVGVLNQLGWDRQLFSHILGARNVGAKQAEIEEAALIGARGDTIREEKAMALIASIGE